MIKSISFSNLYEAQKRRCPLCRGHLILGLFSNRDHIYPKASTGYQLRHNTALVHDTCNSHKGGKQPSAEYVVLMEKVYEKLGVVPFIHQDTGRRITTEELEARMPLIPAWDDIPF